VAEDVGVVLWLVERLVVLLVVREMVAEDVGVVEGDVVGVVVWLVVSVVERDVVALVVRVDVRVMIKNQEIMNVQCALFSPECQDLGAVFFSSVLSVAWPFPGLGNKHGGRP